jgi:exodeoxyribonuclease V alpha subunit
MMSMPSRLCRRTRIAARDFRGIDFKTADAIAMKLSIDKTAMIRVCAGISYALTEAMDEGHCGLPTG